MKKSWSKEKIKEVIEFFKKYGLEETASNFGLKQSSVERYVRDARVKKIDDGVGKSLFLQEIAKNYSDSELEAIAKGGRIVPGLSKVPIISFEGQRIRIGAITDTHIGHERFDKNLLFQAFEEFKKEKVDFITHSGDVTEGMSNRPGHIYELNHIGYNKQKEEAINLLSQWTDTNVYCIDGNHDRWYIKSSGAFIVKDICDALPNYKFLGHDEGDISLKGKAVLKLWHGEDGASYAISYRIQKIIESLTGGEKPGAIIFGHDHKAMYIYERMVHCFCGGCMQLQTHFQRKKIRVSARVGFWIIDLWVNNSGICKTTNTFYPFYT